MKVAFGNDHAGLEMRAILLRELESRGDEVLDVGARTPESVDYPDFARAACAKVVTGEAELGVLICGTGIGISISANKVAGIRCALCHDEYDAQMAREHNDANVLALRGRNFDLNLSRRILAAFLETPFSKGPRHQQRIDKIKQLEHTNAEKA